MNKIKNALTVFTFLTAAAVASLWPSTVNGQVTGSQTGNSNKTLNQTVQSENPNKFPLSEADRMDIAAWDNFSEEPYQKNFVDSVLNVNGINWDYVSFDNVHVRDNGDGNRTEYYVALAIFENYTSTSTGKFLFETDLKVADAPVRGGQNQSSTQDISNMLQIPIYNMGTKGNKTANGTMISQYKLRSLVANNCDIEWTYYLVQEEDIPLTEAGSGEKYAVLLVGEGLTKNSIEGVTPEGDYITIDMRKKQLGKPSVEAGVPFFNAVSVSAYGGTDFWTNWGAGVELSTALGNSRLRAGIGYFYFQDAVPTTTSLTPRPELTSVQGPIEARITQLDSTFTPVKYHATFSLGVDVSKRVYIGLRLPFADMSSTTITQNLQKDYWSATGDEVDATQGAKPVGPAEKTESLAIIRPAALELNTAVKVSNNLSVTGGVGVKFYQTNTSAPVYGTLGLTYTFSSNGGN